MIKHRRMHMRPMPKNTTHRISNTRNFQQLPPIVETILVHFPTISKNTQRKRLTKKQIRTVTNATCRILDELFANFPSAKVVPTTAPTMAATGAILKGSSSSSRVISSIRQRSLLSKMTSFLMQISIFPVF